jgi:hypothetical protein
MTAPGASSTQQLRTDFHKATRVAERRKTDILPCRHSNQRSQGGGSEEIAKTRAQLICEHSQSVSSTPAENRSMTTGLDE